MCQSACVAYGARSWAGLLSGVSLAATALAACDGPAARAAVINVADGATLTAAIHAAHPGDTIQLAAGSYPYLTIEYVNFATPVTLTSANPSSPASIAGLKIANAQGLVLRRLDLNAQGVADPYYAFRIANSQAITLTNLTVHGNVSAPSGPQLNGFYVSNSTNVAISNCQFKALSAGVVIDRDTQLQIIGNSFEQMDKGGVEMGGSSQVVIDKNVFADFVTAPTVHGDAIQIFTYGTTSPAQDIQIEENLFFRGSGVPAQGVFVQDETGNLPFSNIIIWGNAMIGGDWNSIYLSGATGPVQISNNVAASWQGYDVVKQGQTAFQGWVRLNGNYAGAQLVETGNAAQAYIGTSGHAVSPPATNKTLGSVTDNGVSLLRQWTTAHPDMTAVMPADVKQAAGS
jgi:hypothetical protein